MISSRTHSGGHSSRCAADPLVSLPPQIPHISEFPEKHQRNPFNLGRRRSRHLYIGCKLNSGSYYVGRRWCSVHLAEWTSDRRRVCPGVSSTEELKRSFIAAELKSTLVFRFSFLVNPPGTETICQTRCRTSHTHWTLVCLLLPKPLQDEMRRRIVKVTTCCSMCLFRLVIGYK